MCGFLLGGVFEFRFFAELFKERVSSSQGVAWMSPSKRVVAEGYLEIISVVSTSAFLCIVSLVIWYAVVACMPISSRWSSRYMG